MKLLQITDTHITSENELIYSINTTKRLEYIVNHINKKHADADICMITGDLTDNGDTASCITLHDVLDKLKIPYRVTIGNHDNRKNIIDIFGIVENSSTNKIDYTFTFKNLAFIVLDTAIDADDEGSRHAGYLNDRQIDWLKEKIKEYDDYNIYIFMHHPPFKLFLPLFDRILLNENSSMLFKNEMLNSNNIKHIFFGHVHRPVFGSWQSISFSTTLSAAHHFELNLETHDETFDDKIFGYSVVIIDTDGLIMHVEELYK